MSRGIMKIFTTIDEKNGTGYLTKAEFCCNELALCLQSRMIEFHGQRPDLAIVKKKLSFAVRYCPFCGKIIEYHEAE